jgi:hypothetical protein
LFFNPPLNVPIEYDCSNIGANGIFIIVSDACGNSGTCNWTVTVEDNTPPEIICPPNTSITCLDDPEDFEITGFPEAIDNCTFQVSYEDLIVEGNCPLEYDITRTWLVTDLSGNTASCTQLIQVLNVGGPDVTCVQEFELQLDQNGEASIDPADLIANLSENCGDVFTFGLSQEVFTCEDIGFNSITVIVTDECGDTGSCIATINVVDELPPVFINCEDLTISASETMSCEIQFNNNFASGLLIVEDNCDEEPIVYFSATLTSFENLCTVDV